MNEERWIPDYPDGSGWAEVDWVSSIRGSRYHYRHGLPLNDAARLLPDFYRVVTRLESNELEPHENSYFVPRDRLDDFIAEVVLAAGAEKLWHVEPYEHPPDESNVSRIGE
jgi:hypothetical protein